MNKIKVFRSLEEIKKYIDENPNKKICLYIAEKTLQAWNISTSRVYMNEISEDFAYLPVNVEKENLDFIKEIYDYSESCSQIFAINQTQPHKSNAVMKERFVNDKIKNIDSLIKNDKGRLEPYNLNGFSFTSWFEDEVDKFYNKTVIVFGVGGVGEPIARRLSELNVRQLCLVDIYSKEKLVEELSNKTKVKYYKSLNNINIDDDNFILINCAGKEGLDDGEIKKMIEEYSSSKNIFVDLRPQLDIEIVEYAKTKFWKAYTGFGMNSRNDYSLLELIKKYSGITIPSFKEFERLVESAS